MKIDTTIGVRTVDAMENVNLYAFELKILSTLHLVRSRTFLDAELPLFGIRLFRQMIRVAAVRSHIKSLGLSLLSNSPPI